MQAFSIHIKLNTIFYIILIKILNDILQTLLHELYIVNKSHLFRHIPNIFDRLQILLTSVAKKVRQLNIMFERLQPNSYLFDPHLLSILPESEKTIYCYILQLMC